MPPRMAFSPRVTPKRSSNGWNTDGTSMNVNNKLGARASTGKGAFAQKNESGSAMKSLLSGGVENYPSNGPSGRFTVENPMRPSTFNSWGASTTATGMPPPTAQHAAQLSGGAMQSLLAEDPVLAAAAPAVAPARTGQTTGGDRGVVWGLPPANVDEDDEPEYPLPGCRATCDGCGSVVDRFYHCTQCNDPNLFDLCPSCCAAVYLPPERRPAGLAVPCISHATHNLANHYMELVELPNPK